MNYHDRFMVKPGSTVSLDEVDPGFKDEHETHQDALPEIEAHRQRLRELQYRLYSEGSQSLLICLQAMDAAGKDGTVNHVLSAMNPQGCRVYGFKQPSAEEADHDFLWRVHRACPGRGEVAVFNRSHYEDVLVVRVHNLAPKEVWSKRYDRINEFERLLADNRTRILKFYLHISAEEQLERFKKRIDDPSRNWKISDSDYAERRYFEEYKKAFETVFSRCSTDYAPWFVIPANHKWFRNLAISKIVVEALDDMHPEFPKPTVNMAEIKKKYHAAKSHRQK